MKDIHHLANRGVRLLNSKGGGVLVQEVDRLSLSAKILEKQMLDPVLIRIKGDVGGKKVMAFEMSGDGTLWFQGRLCVIGVDGLRKRIF